MPQTSPASKILKYVSIAAASRFCVTHNWENPDTHYQSGVDGHLDWAASQFLSDHLHIGVAGYFFQQLSGDSGSGARLGDFKSRVMGIGPQIGYIFDIGGHQAYFNLRGYSEFDAKNRPGGLEYVAHAGHTTRFGEELSSGDFRSSRTILID